MATGATFQNIFFPFLPTSIAGCQLWLDAADAATVVGTSSVTAWTDKSGKGNNPTFGANKPSYTNNSIITANANQQFTVPSSTIATSTGTGSIFMIYGDQQTGSNGGYSGLFGTASPSERFYQCLLRPDGNSYAVNAPFSPGATITNVMNTTSTLLYNMNYIYNSSTGTLRLNGTNYASSFGGTPIPSGALTLSSTGWGDVANVRLYEVITFTGATALTVPQQQQIEGYLAWKWGLQGNLPPTHPYKNAAPVGSGPTFNSSQVGTIPLSIVRNKVTNPMQGFTPASTGGLTQWLDGADPLGTGTPPALGTLATWYDKSGNGRNASAASAASYTTGGILFTSGNYYTMNVPYSANYSIFLVATNTTNIQCYFFGRNSIGGGRDPTFIQGYIGSGIGLEWYEASDRGLIATTPLSPFIASVDHIQGTSIVGWYYGTQSSSNAQTRTYVANAWDTLGQSGIGANYYAGTLKELIFVGSNVTTPQRQQLEGYLAWKWGLQANLPPGHPYGGNSPFPSTLPEKTISISSIFKPTNYAGCQLWLDAFDPFGNGSRQKSPLTLTRWVDKSSSARNATMFNGSSIAYSPTAFNNRPAFLFTQTQNMSSAAAAGTFSTAFTVFIVYQRTGGGTFDTLVTRTVSNLAAPVDFYTNISTGNFSRNIGNGTAYSLYNTTSGSNFTNVTTPSLYYANATPANGLLDAFNFATPTDPSSGILTGVYYGDTGTAIYIGTRADSVTTLTASVSEVIVYSTTPTDIQRQTIEGYLAWKWGLVASLPAGHPYKNYPPPPQ